MANRIVGNVYIVDAVGSLEDIDLSIYSIAFYSTDTTGELMVSSYANTANVLVHIRNNQTQPFTLPLYLGGSHLDDRLTINRCTAGTAFFYMR